jgi:hypothetical protein
VWSGVDGCGQVWGACGAARGVQAAAEVREADACLWCSPGSPGLLVGCVWQRLFGC